MTTLDNSKLVFLIFGITKVLREKATGRKMLKTHLCGTENGEIFVMSFLQPRQTRKISYREQQELLRITLEEHPEFYKQGMILDTIEKGGKKTSTKTHYPEKFGE